ncbi:MAG: acyl-CoA dehydratase activase-related protein [Proteobacteria bacterium]|nr:acyl-CoA dehydratase activase-related protein [Pseudomonadota bacterium]
MGPTQTDLSPRARLTGDQVAVGIDVGSTTVKTVVVDPLTKQILWATYERHETRQAEKVLEQMIAVGNELADLPAKNIRSFITGSGAGPIKKPLGSKFVQEVNAVSMAVDQLHPEVGSVIELGGQDAKIIIFKENKDTGAKRAIASMNDKCASGTGATIDKCVVKVGMSNAETSGLAWDDSKLHHVAAKCGVFAETDIVNLVKSGIPSAEIMCSLADAIVMQNLSVLTRGNTLRHKVLLLGGPNTYLPFLQACWRQRIPETWEARGYEYPSDTPLEELILVPDNAQYYAAYGAVIYGLHEAPEVGRYQGVQALKDFISHGRAAKLGDSAGPPLVASDASRDDFVASYKLPAFVPAVLEPGSSVRGYIGLDGGSTSSKAVLIDEEGELICKQYQLSKGNPIQDTKEILAKIKKFVNDQGASLEVLGFGATGYAADVLEESVGADVNIVETVAHMMASVRYFKDVDVICDVGGQDIKVLFMVNGDIRNFRLSNQCSAGNGALLQAMADQFGVPVTEYADTAFGAKLSPNFSYGCAVFLDADRVNFQKEGYSKEELLAGLALVLPKNIWQYVVQIPRMAQLGRRYVLQGGTQYNLAALKSQVDYIKDRVPNAEVFVHPHPGEAGAIGAAMETKRVVERRGHSTFIGIEAAIDLAFTSRNDESTVCHFCPNECKRTFIDTQTPEGRTSRYIAGFSCEKGTVESKEALKALTRERKKLKSAYPNLVDYEATLAFKSFHKAREIPGAGEIIDDVQVTQGLFGRVKRRPLRRPILRSDEAARKRRAKLRIGIPKVLNIYSTAPLWRSYFETLGIRPRNVVFSDYTSEEMWAEGGKYGSIDPCYPSKVSQAHIHNLIFHKHKRERLDYIFFPCITNVPTFVTGVLDSTSCPIVAGVPNVVKAAFTKEIDFFERAGIQYVDGAATLTEKLYFEKQMFEMWGERLGITRDENRFACSEGFEALSQFDADLERRGREILEYLEAENRVGVLLLGRPYHNDPGLNHGVLEEFQALGYPILSIRSIPKDPAWLHRFFKDDLEKQLVNSPLSVSDVWPENYSSNSVQKVWAAKFAARHPNVVVLDLSSFKCGHDAPTYGLIDNIISSSGTPYSALHDIDANKPGGSIKIRVKTYAHTLTLHEEKLSDLAARRGELERLVEKKRRDLLAKYSEREAAIIQNNPKARLKRAEMDAAFSDYMAQDPVLPAFARDDKQQMDVWPLPVEEQEFVQPPGKLPQRPVKHRLQVVA